MTTVSSSRGALGWLGAVLGGLLSAAAFAIALAHAETMLIFAAYLAPFPLFMAGLGGGKANGVWASVIGVLGLAVFVSPHLAVVYTAIYALPVALLTALALRYRVGPEGTVYWYPEGFLLTALTIYPALLFLAAVAGTMGHEGGLLGLTTELTQTIVKSLSAKMEADQAALFASMMGHIPAIMPALVGCTWIFLILVSGAGAQATLQQQNWQIRTPFVLPDIHLPQGLVFAAAFLGLVSVLGPEPYAYAGSNVFAMLCVPFVFVGLAVVHAYAATRRARLALLILFYVVLGVLPWLVMLVALVGALDQGLNFRQRLAKLPKPN